MPQLHAGADQAFAEARTSVRPGCTGLWQVGADYHRLIWEAPQYDLFYLRHASLRFDLWILWRTLAMMLGLAQPVSLGEVPTAVVAKRSPSPAASLPGSPAHAA